MTNYRSHVRRTRVYRASELDSNDGDYGTFHREVYFTFIATFNCGDARLKTKTQK